MSSNRDTVLSAIDEGNITRDAIMDATGLDTVQVSNVLYQLKHAGKLTRNVKGEWSRADETDATASVAAKNDLEKSTPPKKSSRPAGKKKTAGHENRKAPRKPASKAMGKREPKLTLNAVDHTYFGEFVVFRSKDVRQLLEALAVLDRWRAVPLSA